MPKVIISPCGTSLLTNGTPELLRKLLIKTSNCKEADFSQEDKKLVDEHCEKRQQQIQNAEISEARKLSAELNGIITYCEHDCEGEFSKSDHYIILATDTYLGRITAKLVVDWLKKRRLNAIDKAIDELSTKDVESFRLAMSEIVRWFDEEIEKQYPRSTWKIVFNLTGGFKSVNGFLQTLAMFYADESVYIFESGGQLLKIPYLPVKLDPEGVIGQHLFTFRQLNVLKKELLIEECLNIPETLLKQINDRVSVSEWGELIWKKCRHEYYSQKLLDPLSSLLQYSDRFKKDTENLPKDRLSIINERLDQISLYLESERSKNPNSLDFKRIKGNPFKGQLNPQPTHECDAWSDQDAKRLYGHFEEKIYIVDKLGKHL